ncbi:hypothetical protein PR202_gb28866 [Eleusine coracana subsp. coracana]|uniref:Uncharacterized protein n=1 Tax=Eleusine coracana subsp. coracana TaxID=191504 RepID=A0AAV5FZ22_ELECO|nr:hypothetical protein PR202_gb28866 [Eleusine coracana subsp. coracana]
MGRPGHFNRAVLGRHGPWSLRDGSCLCPAKTDGSRAGPFSPAQIATYTRSLYWPSLELGATGGREEGNSQDEGKSVRELAARSSEVGSEEEAVGMQHNWWRDGHGRWSSGASKSSELERFGEREVVMLLWMRRGEHDATIYRRRRWTEGDGTGSHVCTLEDIHGWMHHGLVLDNVHCIVEEPAGEVPSSIFTMLVLRDLDLSWNQLSGPIPEFNQALSQLEIVKLRNNKFSGPIPRTFFQLTSLVLLDLRSNNLIGLVDLSSFWKLRNIEILHLSNNKFSVMDGEVLRSNQFYGTIDDTDGDTKPKEYFPSLQIMDLASNNFSGSLRSQWFERLKMMTSKLNSSGEIRFHRNFTAPDEFYRDSIEISYKGSDMLFERILTTLTAIDISSNRLEGIIPESIGRLVSLHVLNLSHNAFTGKIPAQVGGMTDLESLDLSGNQHSGEIPQELTNLTFLGVLNLSNNHLVGKIPQSRQFSTFGSSSFEGNAGLCGPPLSDLLCGALPHTPGVTNVHQSSQHVDVVLFLFVGLGFGVGFAAAIVCKPEKRRTAESSGSFLYLSAMETWALGSSRQQVDLLVLFCGVSLKLMTVAGNRPRLCSIRVVRAIAFAVPRPEPDGGSDRLPLPRLTA